MSCCPRGYYYGDCMHKNPYYRGSSKSIVDEEKRCLERQLQQMQSNVSINSLGQLQPRKEKTMSLVQKVKRLTMEKDDKTLLEANVTDDCGDLTCEGKELLEHIMLQEHKAKLVEMAQKVLDDKEKKKKSKK